MIASRLKRNASHIVKTTCFINFCYQEISKINISENQVQGQNYFALFSNI